MHQDNLCSVLKELLTAKRLKAHITDAMTKIVSFF